MSTGELWVSHQLFPWIVIVLTLWVACSTAVQVRNWANNLRLKRHNRLLQDMVVEGVGSLAKRVAIIEKEICLPEPAPTEVRAAYDDSGSPKEERAESGSSKATCQAG